MRNLTASCAIGLATMAFSTAAFATPVDYNFVFDNFNNGGGIVLGVVRGLEEGTGAATSVEVTFNSSFFGIGEYVGNPQQNSWTVTNGMITAFNFFSFGEDNAAPAVTNASIFFRTGPGGQSGLSNLSDSVVETTPRGDGSSFVTFEAIDVTPVPLPAAGWLLVAGLGGLAAAGRRKKAAA